MRGRNLLMLVTLLHVAVEYGMCGRIMANPEEGLTEAQQFVASIPANQMDDFIKYYLAKGIEKVSRAGKISLSPPEAYESFAQLQEPANFSENLVEFAKEEFGMTEKDVVAVVTQSIVCYAAVCYGPGDIGNVCCPF